MVGSSEVMTHFSMKMHEVALTRLDNCHWALRFRPRVAV